MQEKLIKRTIWTVKCACGHTKEWVENPPKEHQCPKCHIWFEPKEEIYIGPDKI